MSLLEKARESARRARDRAHRRMMSGGSCEEKFAQEGGKKMFAVLNKRAQTKKAKMTGEMPSDKAIRNSVRSFTAVVNGKPLGVKRYFKGEPLAAARKVVSMINREITKKGVIVKPVEFSTLGKNNAVHILLTEVTKGVLKATKVLGTDGKKHREHYVNEYFGYRVADDSTFSRGGKAISAGFKNVVIPARGKSSLAEAEKAKAVLAARPKVAEARRKLIARNASK